MKNVSDAVLRTIGNHKDWTKRYGVVANLVRNPRTPIAISLGMVSRLNPRDMKSVAVDKNVPEAIRKQAQRFVRTPSGGRPSTEPPCRTTTRSWESARTATAAEVRQAYLRLAREKHPDRFADPAEKARAQTLLPGPDHRLQHPAQREQPPRVRRRDRAAEARDPGRDRPGGVRPRPADARGGPAPGRGDRAARGRPSRAQTRRAITRSWAGPSRRILRPPARPSRPSSARSSSLRAPHRSTPSSPRCS